MWGFGILGIWDFGDLIWGFDLVIGRLSNRQLNPPIPKSQIRDQNHEIAKSPNLHII
jgi:hypothetical protein